MRTSDFGSPDFESLDLPRFPRVGTVNTRNMKEGMGDDSAAGVADSSPNNMENLSWVAFGNNLSEENMGFAYSTFLQRQCPFR